MDYKSTINNSFQALFRDGANLLCHSILLAGDFTLATRFSRTKFEEGVSMRLGKFAFVVLLLVGLFLPSIQPSRSAGEHGELVGNSF